MHQWLEMYWTIAYVAMFDVLIKMVHWVLDIPIGYMSTANPYKGCLQAVIYMFCYKF